MHAIEHIHLQKHAAYKKHLSQHVEVAYSGKTFPTGLASLVYLELKLYTSLINNTKAIVRTWVKAVLKIVQMFTDCEFLSTVRVHTPVLKCQVMSFNYSIPNGLYQHNSICFILYLYSLPDTNLFCNLHLPSIFALEKAEVSPEQACKFKTAIYLWNLFW